MTESLDESGVSTLILVDDEEYVLRASRSQLHFDNYSGVEASLEQTFTLTLERGRDLGCEVSPRDAVVPIIVSPLSTLRFQLSVNDATLSPFEGILRLNVPRIYCVKFLIPQISESDYVWDNFQDQIVVHTRLSKLVIRLGAWKHKMPLPLPLEQEGNVLFPISLPDVRTPPLRLFNAIERNLDPSRSRHLNYIKSSAIQDLVEDDKFDVQRSVSSSSLSRPLSAERQSSPSVASLQPMNASPPPISALTTIQSQREAREVILELRKRLTAPIKAHHVSEMPTDSVVSTPETIALDASTKAELVEFNELINAAKDQVRKETARAKNELLYYQQLLPKPPIKAQKPRKFRHLSATVKRPFKLPTLLPDTVLPVNNQEPIPRNQVLARSNSANCIQQKSPQRLQDHQTAIEQQNELQISDSDDSEVDDAPLVVDEPTGVVALDAEDE